jgi:hypothetical protein
VAAVLATMFFVSTGRTDRILQEHVTNGALDLPWTNGFGVSNNMQPATLSPGHPAYDNPSGDHTVGVATNSSVPDSGGIILTATDSQGINDYSWSGWIFTGDGNTRRGLVVRANPANQFMSNYQFVIQSGLFQLNFRKLNNGAPFTMATWFASQLPAGSLPINTWHRMEIQASGNSFRCWLDGYEFTQGTPLIDDGVASGSPPHLTGWAGVYNFRFDLGGVPFYTDDLVLVADFKVVPVAPMSLGQVKQRWAK